MRSSILGAGLATLVSTGLAAQPPEDARLLANAREILKGVPLVDGHNDLPEQVRDRFRNHLGKLDLAATSKLDPPMQTDIPRLRQGGVGGVFFAAFVPAGSGPDYLFEQMDVIRRVTERNGEALSLARTADDVEAIHRSGKVAVLVAIEGGHAIGNSLAVLREAWLGGARLMTLTHVRHNDWADAALWSGVGDEAPRHHGLSAFGREVVREMNRLGMLVDLSHTSVETMHAALETSRAPVVFSHSGAKAVCDHPRNVPDDVLKKVAAGGGVVMVDFVPSFLTNAYRDWDDQLAIPEWTRLEKLYPKDDARVAAELAGWRKQHVPPRVTLADVADHIDHIRKVAGIDAVGIGTDFEGAESFPEGLEDVSRYPALLAELLRRGYTVEDVRKVAGLNILRALRQVEKVAARLQKERPSSDALIEEMDPPAPAK